MALVIFYSKFMLSPFSRPTASHPHFLFSTLIFFCLPWKTIDAIIYNSLFLPAIASPLKLLTTNTENMKKILRTLLFTAVMAVSGTIFAGGILTNTNQSASFVRMPSRNASLNIDAVYYNPAGLVFMDQGWHFSLNNQLAIQKRTITNDLITLNNHTYEGKAVSPVIPNFYAAYVKNNWAFSLGAGVGGGGGSLEFDKGLPSFEAPISMLPMMLTANGMPTTAYEVDMYFKGSSATYGGQLGASYKINNLFSVAVGARVVRSSNAYEGYLRNIQANIGGGPMVNVNQYFTGLAGQAGAVANGLQPVIDAGAGGYTLEQMVQYGEMTQQTADQLKAGLGANYNDALTVTQIQGAYNTLKNNATATARQTADKDVDAKQSGWGFTPIVSVNFNYEGLLIAAKYELKTSMKVKNDTKADSTGLFPDGKEVPADIPAILALGASYKVLPTLTVSLGYNHYFDTDAKMENDRQKYLEHGENEYLAGIEWDCHKHFLVSAGYQYSDLGLAPQFQSDMAHSFSSHSIGLGGAWKVNEKCRINAGYFVTLYTKNSKEIKYSDALIATETYERTNNVFAIGVDFKF